MKTISLSVLFLGLTIATSAGLRGAAATPPQAPKKIRVFILAGQSNMEGKGDGSKLTAEEKAALEKAGRHVRLAYNREPIKPLQVLPASEGNKKRFGVDLIFGPELFFGLRLAEAWPDEQILLIKRSVGATSLYGRWNPDWTPEKAAQMGEEKAEPLYRDMIAYVREVLSGYAPEAYEFCGMLWVQGEADGNTKQFGPEPAETYGANLQNLINRVRHDTGVPDLPFVMVQVGSGKVVDGMKATEKMLKNVTFVPQSNDQTSPNYFPKHEVGHYNYEGQKRIGSLSAAAYLNNYSARVHRISVLVPGRLPERAVVFKNTPQGELKAHFYFPPGWAVSDHRPAMVFWSGGALRSGRATQFLAQAEYFASRGLVTIHVEHRGMQLDHVLADQCVEDARSAMRWVKSHAPEYGVDRDKVIASGGSSGGALAMLTAWRDGPDAIDDDRRLSPRPAALVLFNAAMGETFVDAIGRGGPAQDLVTKQMLTLAIPQPNQPPSILFYGERDSAYLALARDFCRKSRAESVRSEVWVADKMDHGFFNRQPWHNATAARADEFLASLGYLSGPSTIAVDSTAPLMQAAL